MSARQVLCALALLMVSLAVGSCAKTTDSEDTNDVSEKPYSIDTEKFSRVEKLYKQTDLSVFQTIPFTRFDTNGHRIKVEFNPDSFQSRIRIDGTYKIAFPRKGIPLEVVDHVGGGLGVVFREMFSGKLYLYHIALPDGSMNGRVIDGRMDVNLLMRGAVVHQGMLYVVVYDNVEEFNYIYSFILDGDRFVEQRERIKLPSVEDPAGTHYEMIPRVILRSEEDGLFIFAGRSASVLRKGRIAEYKRPDNCWRILESVRSKEGWVVLCNSTRAGNKQRYQIFNLKTEEVIEYDPDDGVPWKLTVSKDGIVRWLTVKDAADLRDMFLNDIVGAKNCGVLNFGVNNMEGRVPWSQVYYLNGLLDILYLVQRDERIYDIFHPLAAEIKRRLDLEIHVLDELIGEEGVATRAFTVGRKPAVFAVQTARILMLLNRYRKEVTNAVQLRSYDRFKSYVYSLKDHMETLSRAEGGDDPLVKRDGHYLRWPKGNAFYFDGLNVPYNHQNEWANAIFDTVGGSVEAHQDELMAAEDIIRNFLKDVAGNGVFPESGIWPYWYGKAYEGWDGEEAVSVNTPEYKGDRSNAWISFRTIDLMAVLSAKRYMRELIGGDLVDSAVQLVNKGKVYPFASRILNELGHYPRLTEAISRDYLRINSPWEISNMPWAYLRLNLDKELRETNPQNITVSREQ